MTIEPKKYYVIVHGARQAWMSTVHTEDCPLFPRFRHAKEKNYNPLDNDKWNHYQACPRCLGKISGKKEAV